MINYTDEDRKYIETVWEWLHAHPEIGLETRETSAFVAAQLRSFGYDVISNIGGGFGVLGIWDTHSDGPVLGLRADMDSLLFTVDGKSTCCHSCGHDAHAATLLTAAKIPEERHPAIGEVHLGIG